MAVICAVHGSISTICTSPAPSCCDCQRVTLTIGDDMVCLSSTVTPHIERQVGAGVVTIPALSAYGVSVAVITGPIDVQAGAEPAVSLPTGSNMAWSVDSCEQRIAVDLVFTAAMPGHDFIVAWTT